MQLKNWRVLAPSAVCCTLVSGLIAFAAAAELRAPHAAARPAQGAKSRFVAPAEVDGLALLKRARVENEKLWSTLESGERALLTLDPTLQAHVEKLFAQYQVPAAALVAIEPSTGRILAYVSHSFPNGPTIDRAIDSSPPAASVFKVITSAALIDAGVSPETRMCYGGGASSLQPVDLVDNPKRDRTCVTLAYALGHSTNAVFAKLASRKLDPAALQRYADLFGFGKPLTTELRATAGACDVPEQSLEFARTAAGFWHSHLSPLHAALIAATIANGGVMPHASMIERVVAPDGRLLHSRASQPGHRVISQATAREVGQMMLRTVSEGTAHDAFYDRGRPFLGNVSVAGKTGSLSGSDPYRAYSWWMGFAPANDPQVALAALVVNGSLWRIKSSFVARDALMTALPPQCGKSGRNSDPRCAKTQRK
ncbi:MAG TPA: penicillin-binding transpeptidase domain-containing protein [Polyangiales bacterium]|nr:penicillin-binding transpeptidase domain-containing protein [Polyangiales bacterium]